MCVCVFVFGGAFVFLRAHLCAFVSDYFRFCVYMWVCMLVFCLYVVVFLSCECVCGCVRERERERERDYLCV